MQNLLVTPEVTFQPPAMDGLHSRACAPAKASLPSPSPACGAADTTQRSSCTIAPAPSKLVGIARLAQSSPRVRERTGVEYFALPARSALNRESSGRLPFAWTLNP